MMDRNLKKEILSGKYIPRPSVVAGNTEMRKDSDVMSLLIKNNNMMICLYLGRDERIFKLAIDCGFNITEDLLKKYPNLGESTLIMIQAIKKQPNLICYYRGSDERLFKYALNKGVEIDENVLKNYPHLCNSEMLMKLLIQKNPSIVKKYNGPIITKCSLYLYAIEHGYQCDIEEIQELINIDTIRIYPQLIKFYKGNDANIIATASSKGFASEEKVDLNNLDTKHKKSASFMKKMIDIDPNNVLYYEGDDETVFQYALDKGFIPDENNLNDTIRTSFCIACEIIKKNPYSIHSYRNKYSKVKNKHYWRNGSHEYKELMRLAIQNGYIPTIEDCDDLHYYSEMMDIMIPISIKKYPNSIIYYKGNDETMFEEAIKNGFVISEDLMNKISNIHSFYNNSNFLHSECIIKYIYENNIDLDLIAWGDTITIEIASRYGYEPNYDDLIYSYEEKRGMAYSSTAMIKMIKKDCKLIVYYLGRDEQVFQEALNNGYIPNLDDLKQYDNLCNSSTIMKRLISHIEPFKSNKNLQRIVNLENINMAMDYSTLERMNEFLQKNDIYNVYSDEDVLKICKYVVALYDSYDDSSNTKSDIIHQSFYKIIDNGHLNILDRFIKYIYDIPNCNKKYFISLIDNVNVFYDNFELINDVLNNMNLSLKEKNMVINVIQSSKLSFKSIDEIRAYYNNKITETRNNIYNLKIDDLRSIIKDLLGNPDLEEYCFTTIKDLEKLKDNIVDENSKNELTIYILYFSFLDKLQQIDDIEDLRKIVLRIIDYIEKNPSIHIFDEMIHKVKSRIKVFYSQELSERLINFDKLPIHTERYDYKIEKRKLLASDISLYGEQIGGIKVDYIELNGLDYLALVHVLNAYGGGGTLSDFKYPRAFGKSYICLSAIGNEHMKTATESDSIEVKEEEKVTLIFNNIESDQLVMESYDDLYSYGSTGSLKISSERAEHYTTIDDLISRNSDERHNELVFYREKDNGGSIYPTAVLATRKPPLQSEINAAAYLNIPVVYVDKEKYLNREVQHEIESVYDKKEIIESYKLMLEKLNELKESILEDKSKKV